MKVSFICSRCKSDDIFDDATAIWSETKQEMVLGETFGEYFCRDCDAKTEIEQINIK